MNDRISRRATAPVPPPRAATPAPRPPAAAPTRRAAYAAAPSRPAPPPPRTSSRSTRHRAPAPSAWVGSDLNDYLRKVTAEPTLEALTAYLQASRPVDPPAPITPPPSPAQRARTAGLVVEDQVTLPAMGSWQDFLDRMTAADTTGRGHSRLPDDDGWAGAAWPQAVRLATDGWHEHIPETDLALTELRTGAHQHTPKTRLVQTADVSGSEVDVAAYLAGIPECMLETELHSLSTQGRVVTFLVPAGYSCRADHPAIINRGKALCVLGAAIVRAGHSIEVWSGFASRCPGLDARCRAVTKIVSAGEPFDPGRLMFAMAHPAMLRRCWLGVWDAATAEIARAMQESDYGTPQASVRADLPDDVDDAYVFPPLDESDHRWSNWEHALEWSTQTFSELGLIAT